MQRNSPGRTPRFKFSMMVLPPSTSVASANAICGGAREDTGASWRFAAMAMGSVSAAWRIDEVDGRMQMFRQHRLSAGNVAREHTVGEQLMRTHEFLAAVELAHHHAAIPVRLIVEIGMGSQHALGAACPQQRGVKALVQPVEILSAFAEFVAGAFDMPAHLVQRAENTGLPGVVTLGDGEPDSLDLDRGAHAGDVGQILAADIGDAKTALPDPDDQAA